MLSKAFSKSTKLMYSCLCHSVHCSMMLRSMKIWSVHPLPRRKPACSCLSCLSTASDSRWTMTFARILLGMDSSVIPRQLLQLLRAPFFGILMIMPSDQSSGISFPSHMSVNRGRSMLAASSGSALFSSAIRLFCPGAFLFLRDLIAEIISSFSGGAV